MKLNTPVGGIGDHFASIEDPRKQYSPPHDLLEIIIIAICGVICGANDWVAIETFGKSPPVASEGLFVFTI